MRNIFLEQVASLRQKLELQGKDFDSRMRATEDLNRQTINELREMLTAQQRVGSKYVLLLRQFCHNHSTLILFYVYAIRFDSTPILTISVASYVLTVSNAKSTTRSNSIQAIPGESSDTNPTNM